MLSCALLKLWWYLYIGELNLSTFCMQHLAISNRFPIFRSHPPYKSMLRCLSISYNRTILLNANARTHTHFSVVCFWSEVHRLAWIICIYIHHSIGLQQFLFLLFFLSMFKGLPVPQTTHQVKQVYEICWLNTINRKHKSIKCKYSMRSSFQFQSIITLDIPHRLQYNKHWKIIIHCVLVEKLLLFKS